jgi:hypothetical protein
MILTKTLFLVALTAVAASASVLAFTETITTSGSLDGTAFTNHS